MAAGQGHAVNQPQPFQFERLWGSLCVVKGGETSINTQDKVKSITTTVFPTHTHIYRQCVGQAQGKQCILAQVHPR